MAAVYVNERENSFVEIMKICGTFVSKTKYIFKEKFEATSELSFPDYLADFQETLLLLFPATERN